MMLPPGLLVVHDAPGGGQHHVPELSGGQEVVCPLLDLVDGDIKPWGDDATLVEAPGEVDDDLAGPMVVDHLELSDVAFLHHDGQEPDDHLGAWADQDLPLASLLGNCTPWPLHASNR